MQKNVSIRLLLAAMIAVFTLIATSEILAQELPLVCTAGVYTIEPSPDHDFPFYDETGSICGAPGYAWVYRITPEDPKDLAKITKIHFFIPSSPGALVEMVEVHVFDRGEPGVSSNWAEKIYNGIVVTVTHISGLDNYVEVTICSKDVKTYGVVSTVIVTAKGEFGCVSGTTDIQGPIGGIIGPGFSLLAEDSPAEVVREVGLSGGGCVLIKKHPVTGCIKEFWTCPTDTIPSQRIIGNNNPNWITDKSTVDFGDFENRLCREGIITLKGSPTQYWGYANGSYYCIGEYDPDVPSWVSPCP